MDGSCVWEDMEDQFEIGRSSLTIHTPLQSNGDIDCVNSEGERKFPKLDYSKGFPDWWYLSQTDITVPSEHVQHGKRYAAEVKLSHFYELDHYKNKLGTVSFFMQDFENEGSWPYLDKLICKWRAEEETKRNECGLPPAPVYKMCELYRGQERTAEDLESHTETETFPTVAPLVAPPAIPVQNIGADPEEFRLPLALCEGDCDFDTDCAPGLWCEKREPFGAVTGCIGGETDSTTTDYCVFDQYGIGYTPPTPVPTNAPTITSRPTIEPLPAQPLVDYGGTPPASNIPLKICEGDCDKDEDCDQGLICFQRTSNETVPGCIGGESDIEKTDYCVLDPFGPGYLVDSEPSPASSPVASSTAPFTRPIGDPIRVQNLGWEPPIPLKECAGDCDVDSDCEAGLICYQRNTANEDVPGCLGGDEDPSLTDYCAYPPVPTMAPTQGTQLPTAGSNLSPPTMQPSANTTAETPTDSGSGGTFELLPLKDWGWTPPSEVKPLGRCEGDCDIRQDCASGLDCFQRYLPNLPVPGCSGGQEDVTLTDYCIPIELMNGGSFETTAPTDGASDTGATTAPAEGTNETVAPGTSPVDTLAPWSSVIPPTLDCSAFPAVSFSRMCKVDSCCVNPRSESDFCHKQYRLLGDDVESACHHCCLEEVGSARTVGPANVANPDIPALVVCDTVVQPERICREGSSCCDISGSRSEFCQQSYQLYTPEEMESICVSAIRFSVARSSTK